MNDVLEAMIGYTLLFGTDSKIIRTSRPNDEYEKRVQATKDWANKYKNSRKEQQIFELLKTYEGQRFVRKELRNEVIAYNEGSQFEFAKPLLKNDIISEVKWALTWMLAKEGHVPSWQSNGVLYFTNYYDIKYARGQCELLRCAGCDVELLEYAINNSRGFSMAEYNSYSERKSEARKIREEQELSNLKRVSNKIDASKEKWFEENIDDKLELELFRIIAEQEPLSPLIIKYFGTWDKLKMNRYHPETWRRDSKAFYQKWIALWEMAERGKLPSWQVGWVPNYFSDYVSFLEQIRIFKEYDYDPWPLIQQLPTTIPKNHRTLEEVVFKK